jgi:hypothetical protein
VVAALERSAKELGSTVQAIAIAASQANAREDLPTIYKAFLRLAAPVRVMNFTPQLWRTYVGFAEVRGLRNEPGYYRAECVNIPARTLEWATGGWLGFIPSAIEIAGGRRAQGRVLERSAQRAGGDLYTLLFECAYTPP